MRKLKAMEQRKRKAPLGKETMLKKRNRKVKNLTVRKGRSKYNDGEELVTDKVKNSEQVIVTDLKETSETDGLVEACTSDCYVSRDVVVVDAGSSQESNGLSETDSSYVEKRSTLCELLLKVSRYSEKSNNQESTNELPDWTINYNSTPQRSKHYNVINFPDVSIVDVEGKPNDGVTASIPSVNHEDEQFREFGRNPSKRKRRGSKARKRDQKLMRMTESLDNGENLEKRNKINLQKSSRRVSSDGKDEDGDYSNDDGEEEEEYNSKMSPLLKEEDNSVTTEMDATPSMAELVSNCDLSKTGVSDDLQRTVLPETNSSLTEMVKTSCLPSAMEKRVGNVQKDEILYRIFKHKGREQYLVLFKKEASVPFVGRASINVICGSVTVNGFNMNTSSRWHAIYSASFNHLMRLNIQLSLSHVAQPEVMTSILKMVEEHDREEMEAFLRDHDSFSAFQLRPLDCLAWDFASQMQTFSELMNDVQYESDLGKEYAQYFSTLGLFLCPDSGFYVSRAIRSLPGQVEVTHQIMKAFAELRSPPVIVICGKKGTGKSTMCRNLINQFLNRIDGVCYLEADSGQSEFTPSCILSLHEVKEPMLGLPFVHQRTAEKMFFYGSNDTKNSPDLYLHMVSLLHGYYLNRFSSRPLIVNTNGWMSGLGGAILQDIFQILKPSHIISMQDPADRHPYDFNNQTRWLSNYSESIIDFSSKIFEVKATPGRLSGLGAAQHRSLTLIGYFSSLLQPLLTGCSRLSLAAVTPYVVPWSSVAVYVCNSVLSPNHILYALNGTAVGLCAVDSSKIFDIEGTIPSDGLPKILKETSVCECLGVGLIRGIDPASKVFYIITPVPPEKLGRINALIKGTHSLPLTALKQGFKVEDMPYVCTSYNQVIGCQPPKSRKYLIRNSSDRSFSKR